MKMTKSGVFASYLVILCTVLAFAADTFIKSSTEELVVNSEQVLGDQSYPSIVALTNGDIAIAYADPGGIYITKPFSDVPSIVRVNSFSEKNQTTPIIVLLNDGFIVLWLSNGQQNGSYGIHGQKFTNSFRRVGNEFQINRNTSGNQGMPAYPVHDGVHYHAAANYDRTGFLVVWSTSPGNDIMGRYFDQDGNPLTDDFQINNYTTDYQMYPRVLSIGTKEFCVTWDSHSSSYEAGKWAGSFKTVDRYGNSNNESAILVSDIKLLKDYVGEHSKSGAVDLGDGKILVYAWAQNKDPQFIATQVIYSNGTRIGQQGKIISNPARKDGINPSEIRSASFSVRGNRFAVLVWSSNNCDGSDLGIQAVMLDSDGNIIGDPFLVNTEYMNNQSLPQVAVQNDSNGSSFKLVFTYQSNGVHDTGFDIRAISYTLDLRNYRAFLPNQLNPTFIHWLGEQSLAVLPDTNVTIPWITTMSNGTCAAVCVNDPGTTPLRSGSLNGASTDLNSTRLIGMAFSRDSLKNISNIIQANQKTKGNQTIPVVATLANDSLATCWVSNDDVMWKIVCSIFDKDLNSLGGGEFIVNTNNLGDEAYPNKDCKLLYCNNRFDLIPINNGNSFVVVFSAGQGDALDIYAVIYNVSSAGAQLFKPAFVINTNSGANQAAPKIVELPSGGFMIMWASNWDENSKNYSDIRGRVFDTNLTAITDELKINKYAWHTQYAPNMIVLENGNVLVMWIDEERSLLVTQMVDSQLTPIGSENRFNISLTTWFELPRGIHLVKNYFAITLSQGNGKDGDGNGCFVAYFDPSGRIIGDFMQVSQTYKGNQQNCQIAKFPNENRFIIIWDSADPYSKLSSVGTCQYSFTSFW